MKKILITGSTGMLGAELIRYFSTKNEFDVYSLGRTLVSYLAPENQILLDLVEVSNNNELLKSFKFDFVIHTAAITDLTYCEQNIENAYLINSQLSGELSRCFDCFTHFIYISTDSIFNGIDPPFKETNIPIPLNVYSKSKLQGELFARQLSKGKCTIVRTNIYGFNIPLKNSLFEWAMKEWHAGNKINGFDDVIFNAVYTSQLAHALYQLLLSKTHFPIINIGSVESISKWSFLNKVLENTNYSRDLLKKVRSIEFKSSFKRPLNTSLSVDLFCEHFTPLTFEEGIKQCIYNFKKHNNEYGKFIASEAQ